MQTQQLTVWLPETVAFALASVAAARRLTIRAVVEDGLRRYLSGGLRPTEYRSRTPRKNVALRVHRELLAAVREKAAHERFSLADVVAAVVADLAFDAVIDVRGRRWLVRTKREDAARFAPWIPVLASVDSAERQRQLDRAEHDLPSGSPRARLVLAGLRLWLGVQQAHPVHAMASVLESPSGRAVEAICELDLDDDPPAAIVGLALLARLDRSPKDRAALGHLAEAARQTAHALEALAESGAGDVATDLAVRLAVPSRVRAAAHQSASLVPLPPRPVKR